MPYLNSDVFYASLPADAAELVPLPPRAMAAAAEAGELEAGPLPIAEVLRLDDLFEPLGDLCVATRRESVSILLFSKRPINELGGSAVAVTDHTASSVQLMRVLFRERWQVTPGAYVRLDEAHEARLLIGDPALKSLSGIDGYPHRCDLGSEWFEHTGGLPFVYARWVVRRDANPSEAAMFYRTLERAFAEGMGNLGQIAAGRPELGMPIEAKLAYLEGFSYRMGDLEHAAVDRFRQSLTRLPAWRPTVASSAAAIERQS